MGNVISMQDYLHKKNQAARQASLARLRTRARALDWDTPRQKAIDKAIKELVDNTIPWAKD